MSDMENDFQNQHNDETSVEEFLGKGDKIIIEKKPQKTVTIIKHDNNSGMGEAAPYSISRKFNWGAFLFNWIWGIKYKKLVLLLVPVFCFIPFGFLVSIAISFYAGVNGNQWAWEEIQYKDEEDFHHAQKSWVKTWFILAAILLVLAIPIYLYKNHQSPEETVLPEDIYSFSSLELNIPPYVFEQTTSQDSHSDIITADKNVIYWLRPQNAHTQKDKEYIETVYNSNDRVKQSYILYPDLKVLKDTSASMVKMELEASCENETCIDTWLYKSCNTGFCIINPKARKYYKVRGKSNVIPKALYIKNKWK